MGVTSESIHDGLPAVILGQRPAVTGDVGHLEEQLIALVMLEAVCLSAIEVLLNESRVDHEPVRLNDRLQGVADAAFLLDVEGLDHSPRGLVLCPGGNRKIMYI